MNKIYIKINKVWNITVYVYFSIYTSESLHCIHCLLIMYFFCYEFLLSHASHILDRKSKVWKSRLGTYFSITFPSFISRHCLPLTLNSLLLTVTRIWVNHHYNDSFSYIKTVTMIIFLSKRLKKNRLLKINLRKYNRMFQLLMNNH